MDRQQKIVIKEKNHNSRMLYVSKHSRCSYIFYYNENEIKERLF